MAIGASAALFVCVILGQAAPVELAHAGVFYRDAVAADHPLASEAGASILREGGNAADAAAATMLALGVVSPASSGLGGGGFALYYRASDQSLHVLDFRESAPSGASAAMFERREGEDDLVAAERSRTGGLAVAVPGEPAGIDALISRFGSGRVGKAQIATPAERYARQGVPASRYLSDGSAMLGSILRADRWLASWVPQGADRIPLGAPIRNPELASTLRTFGRQGAAPFYRGAIARAIVQAVQAHGGVITMDDLAHYAVRDRAPLSATRFGYRFVTMPPPSAGGFTILHSLALMEHWQPEGGWREGAAFRHALSQSWSGAFVDRAAYLGDPDHAEIPLGELLSEERLARRAALFDPLRMRSADDWELPLDGPEPHETEPPSGTGTSHLCVVDAEGNIAAVTTTINLLFGARVSAAGIVLNDEMDDFAREVGVANYFGLPGGAANLPAPGRRPVSSMSPTIVFSEDDPVLCIGASGGSRIITATEQVMLSTLLLGEPVDEAVRRPRIHHQGRPETTLYERRYDRESLAGLWGRGHRLQEVDTVGNVQAIRIESGDGGRALHAASDPRKEGAPRGN